MLELFKSDGRNWCKGNHIVLYFAEGKFWGVIILTIVARRNAAVHPELAVLKKITADCGVGGDLLKRDRNQAAREEAALRRAELEEHNRVLEGAIVF